MLLEESDLPRLTGPPAPLDLAWVKILEGDLRGSDGAPIDISHNETFLQGIGVERAIGLELVPWASIRQEISKEPTTG